MHRTTTRFWKCFEQLPTSVQEAATKSFARLKSDPFHPSLHFKKVGTLWSVRVGSAHRALAVEESDGYIWVWIGPHDEYERIIKNCI